MATKTVLEQVIKRRFLYLSDEVASCAGLTLEQLVQLQQVPVTDAQIRALAIRMSIPL